jgi:hypothetical protein
MPWLVVTAVAAAVLLYFGLQRLGLRRWSLRLLVVTVLPVVVSVLMAGVIGITFQVRHVLWASIPLFVVLGAAAAESRVNRAAALALMSLLVVFGVSWYNRHYVAAYQTEDLRSLAAYLQRTSPPDTPVFVLSGYMAAPVRHYLNDHWTVYPMPDIGSSVTGQQEAVGYLRSRLHSGAMFWLAYTREFHGDPQGRFLDELLNEGVLRRTASFPGAVLYQGRAE